MLNATINPATIIPDELKPDDILAYKVVAVIGFGHDWAAYRGPSSWPDEKIATVGDKISREAAEALFYAPVAAGPHYRS